MALAESLKKILKQRNMTAARLGKLADISPKTISDWVNGRSPRDMMAIKRCAMALGISVHQLLYDEDDPQSLKDSKSDLENSEAGIYEIIIKKIK